MRFFSIGTRGVSLLLAMLAWMIVAMPLHAQDEPAADAAPAATEETAPADEGGDAAEAPAEEAEAEPTFADVMLDPEVSNEEFELRLIPLTASELEALANEWLGIVRNDTQAVVEERIRSRSEDDEVAAGAAERVVAQTEALKLAFDKFNLVLINWIKKGGDEAVINEFQSYRSAVLIDERRTADFQAVVQEVINWAISPTGGIALLIDVGIVVGSFILLFMVAGIISRFARRMLTRVPNVSTLLKDFLGKVFFWVTIAIGLMVVLSMLGIDVTPMLALLGGASFIIAFAMQDTLSNLAAGLMIMINRPFDVGDYVDIGGVGGTVQTVSIVSTTVTTPDNQVIVVPNSNVWGNVITNVTSSPTRRVDMTFGIGYSDSIEKAQSVLEEIAAEHPLVLDDPEPTIRVSSLGASSVDFIFRPWTRGEDYWTVFWDMQRIVKERFDAEGISIPFPQTDMHIKMDGVGNGDGKQGQLPFATTSQSSGDYSTGDEGHDRDDRGE